MSVQPVDPWAGADKTPSVSFKDAPVGTVHSLTITEKASLVQSRDYNTGEPKFWPVKTPSETPNPVMAAVIRGTDENGEERALWAQRPSALFVALAAARKTSPTGDLEIGGTLDVKYTGEKPNENNPRLNPAKQYAVRYTAPAASASTPDTDPWAGTAEQPVPAF